MTGLQQDLSPISVSVFAGTELRQTAEEHQEEPAVCHLSQSRRCHTFLFTVTETQRAARTLGAKGWMRLDEQ